MMQISLRDMYMIASLMATVLYRLVSSNINAFSFVSFLYSVNIITFSICVRVHNSFTCSLSKRLFLMR
uniref:Uncharacterized protein n=1 Tax=Panstrongylus lignarius TaxID=156445 RepID=A0A224XUX2_9HEMI